MNAPCQACGRPVTIVTWKRRKFCLNEECIKARKLAFQRKHAMQATANSAGLSFSQALGAMKAGECVRRAKFHWVEYRLGHHPGRPEVAEMQVCNVELRRWVMWRDIGQEDLLAEDWCIAERIGAGEDVDKVLGGKR